MPDLSHPLLTNEQSRFQRGTPLLEWWPIGKFQQRREMKRRKNTRRGGEREQPQFLNSLLPSLVPIVIGYSHQFKNSIGISQIKKKIPKFSFLPGLSAMSYTLDPRTEPRSLVAEIGISIE